MAVFFNPETEFDYRDGEIQSGDTSLEKTRFMSPDGAGGFVRCATSAYNPRTVRHEVFHIHKAAGDTFTVPSMGRIVNGWHLDKVRVEYSPDAWPIVTIDGHRHGDADHIPTESGYTFTPTLTFPAGWGVVPSWCGDGGRSATYTLEVQHAELPDEDGNVVQSDSYGGVETAVGGAVNAVPHPPAEGWIATVLGGEEVLQGIHYKTREFFHAMQSDEPEAVP